MSSFTKRSRLSTSLDNPGDLRAWACILPSKSQPELRTGAPETGLALRSTTVPTTPYFLTLTSLCSLMFPAKPLVGP